MGDNISNLAWRLRDWKSLKAVSTRGAALLINHHDPLKYPSNKMLPPDAQVTFEALEKAVLSRQLGAFAVIGWGIEPGDSFDGVCDIPDGAIGPHTKLSGETTLRVADLAAWCDRNRIEHPFRVEPENATTTPARNLDGYPDKLRTAIEAFEAVSRDPAATAKHSVKAALIAWLAQNKPELSSNARDCIATIANWQPQGGAPKTLG